MTVLWVALIVIAQVWVPALAAYLLLRRRSALGADEVAALSLGLAPLVTCVAVLVADAIGWHVSGFIGVGASALVAVAALVRFRRDTAEFLRQPITGVWALAALFWLGQELMVYCHGRGHWTWDWEHHFHLTDAVFGLLWQGYPPVVLGRTVLIGIWAAPSLSVSFEYWVFQVTTVIANSFVLLPAYLWGRRLGGAPRGGYLACALVLLCPGLAHNAIYTWPKVFAADLIVLALYLYTVGDSRDGWRTRTVWEIAAGLALAAAFQAHSSTGLYAAAFFGLAAVRLLRRPRRYPWVMLLLFVGVTGVWLAAMVYRYSWSEMLGTNPYFSSGEVGAGKQWHLFREHVRTTFLPMTWIGEVNRSGWLAYWTNWWSDTGRQDLLLRSTTDVWLPTFPVVGTIALVWAAVRRGRRRVMLRLSAERIAGVGLLLGGFITLLFLEPAGLGAVQTALTPLLVFALACAGPLTATLTGSAARCLWLVSLVQFVLFRGFYLTLNVIPSAADEPNLTIKHNAHITYAVEYSDAVLPIAAAATVVALLLVIILLWRAIGADRSSEG